MICVKFNYEKILVFFILFMCFLPYQVNANIICNDGTVSSGCSDCHQGCCSRHGGCTAGGSSYSSNRTTSRSSKSKSSSSVAKSTKKVAPVIVKKSSNNKLKKVIIDGKAIPLSKSMSYTTTKEKVSIAVELESSKASASYNKSVKLTHGDNKEKIIVTAENGAKATYELNIKLLSSNTQLSEVLVNNSSVSVFKNMNCDSSENVAIIKVIPEDSSTKLEYDEMKELTQRYNIVNIKAVAENGNEATYELKIRLLSSDVRLNSVLVNDSKISVSDDMDYDSSEKNVVIKVVAEDPNTKLEYDEKKDLEVGDNIVNIKATSESGKTKNYTLNIKYEKLGIADYIATTTVLGGAIAGICYAVNKRKKTRNSNSNKESYNECYSCHKLNEKGDKFCMYCGKKLN